MQNFWPETLTSGTTSQPGGRRRGLEGYRRGGCLRGPWVNDSPAQLAQDTGHFPRPPGPQAPRTKLR